MNVHIITICYNDFNNLLRTIKSVEINKMDYHRFYIIDGNSKDSIKELICEYNSIIDDFIIENDLGIYNAMNKALRFDSIKEDDYIYWLNAGDELQRWDDDILSWLQNVDCCFAGVLLKKSILSNVVKSIYPRIVQPYNEKTFFPCSLYMHQGFLLRKRTFDKYLYDENIGLQAENLLMSKCILNENCVSIRTILATYYADGISNTKHYDVYKSFLEVLKKLKMSRLLHVMYHPIFHLKYIVKILLSFIR